MKYLLQIKLLSIALTLNAVILIGPINHNIFMVVNNNMNMNLVDSELNTPRTNDKVDTANAMDSEEMQVRTMEVPRWLSTPDVTKYLVGNGKGKALEEEYECTICIAGQGSGTKDASVPGYHLPHLLVTMSGMDVRQLGRIRRALEDSLVDYIIENTPNEEGADEYNPNPPPSLGRLLYSLGISSANASPNTKDHRPDMTVLARSHFPISLHTKRESIDGGPHLMTKKVWMNVVELPQDAGGGDYHGRFLASKSFMNYYKNHFHCRVDIYGVWGDDPTDRLMCAPYVLITSDEKVNVDKCIQYIEHRIREHEEKFGVSRAGGRRVLRGERIQMET